MGGPGILYNTVMGLAAATALLLLPLFARAVARGERELSGWSFAFAGLGVVMLIGGVHMTLTWPLQNVPPEVVQHCCAADNVTFGEPSMYFGALFVAGGAALLVAQGVAHRAGGAPDVVRVLRPLTWAAAAGGLMLLAIAAAGARYGMWEAPEEEPLSGEFKGTHLETAYVTATYVLTAVGALLSPFALDRARVARIAGAAVVLAGASWLWITLVSYYGHIALAS